MTTPAYLCTICHDVFTLNADEAPAAPDGAIICDDCACAHYHYTCCACGDCGKRAGVSPKGEAS